MFRKEILNDKERKAVESAIFNLDTSNFCYTDSPVDRRVDLAKGRIWVYWLREFSPITKQWFIEGARKIPFSLGVKKRVYYLIDEVSPGIVVLKFRWWSLFTKKAVWKKVKRKKQKYISWLIKEYWKNFSLLEGRIKEIESKESPSPEDIIQLFELLTTFVSIALEKIFPFKLFEKMLRKYQLDPGLEQAIFYSSRSGYKETYLEFLKLAHQVHYGMSPNLSGLKNRIGFIGVTDLKKAPLEKDERILVSLKYYLKRFPTSADIRVERARLKAQNRKCLGLQEEAVKKILEDTPERKKPYLKGLLRFAKTAATSNENRRFLVTKSFKIIRNTLKNLKLDPQTTTLAQLIETLKNN